jgi:anti-sigma B factor antagonist
MEFQAQTIDDVIVIRLPENLVANNIKTLKQVIDPFIKPNARIVLDMGRLRIVDSSGIGAILSYLKRVKSLNGALKLCTIDHQIMDFFKVMRLDHQFTIYESRQDAVMEFSGMK